MQRGLLLDENRSEEIDVTPLRRSLVRRPRLRLLDKHTESGNASRVRVSCLSSTVDRNDPEIISEPRRYAIPQDVCTGDRFIRSRYNADASHYLLTRKTETALEENTLDVLGQVKGLPTNWRKKLMHQLMEEGNVIPGLGQRKILGSPYRSNNNSVKKLPGSLATRPKELWSFENDPENGMWWSRPRTRPLIGSMDSILDVPGFRNRDQMIDWGSNGVISAVTQDTVTFYDTRASETAQTLRNVKISNVHALKWNHAGNMLAICTSSDVKLYCCETRKIIWSTKCEQATRSGSSCYQHCACWSEDDLRLVVGCTGLITCYESQTGKPTSSCETEEAEVMSLAFSCNYKYIASLCADGGVRIFLWPSLVTYVYIFYYEFITAMAWHPREGGRLCVGFSSGLALWNVNDSSLDATYRKVSFHGLVVNLAWNSLTGELLVHWRYRKERGGNWCTMMPVLASLDRVVDVLPVDAESRVYTVIWSPNHLQLAVQFKEPVSIWNFFGNEYPCYNKEKKKDENRRKARDDIKSGNFKGFRFFNIR